jgi:hypothetical protein
MNAVLGRSILAVAWMLSASTALASDFAYQGALTLGSDAFNYHGTLQDRDAAAEGPYDLQLTLYSAPTGGVVVAGPLMLYGVPMHNGSFNTTVDLRRQLAETSYLEVEVRHSGAADSLVKLDGRAPVSPSAVTTWQLAGNAGIPNGSYLGTADNVSLLIQTAGQPALRISPPLRDASGNSGTDIVAGYSGNAIDNTAVGAVVIGGGFEAGNPATLTPNAIRGNASYSAIGGGRSNTIQNGGLSAVIAGGDSNVASGEASAVGGGYIVTATGDLAVAAGGYGNAATAEAAVVSGGYGNEATGITATVPGGDGNYAGGDASFAAGTFSHVRDATETGIAGGDFGTFIWNGSFGSLFRSTGSEQFLVHAAGGVGINTAQAPNGGALADEVTIAPMGLLDGGSSDLTFETATTANAHSGFRLSAAPGGNFYLYGLRFDGTTLSSDKLLTVAYFSNGWPDFAFHTSTIRGPITVGDPGDAHGNGAYLTNGGAWTNGSSRAFKESFANVDPIDVLEKLASVPVQTWFYKGSRDEGQHMGPVAEDFASVFGLGSDDKHITTVDESGVALAAIQGLNRKMATELAEKTRQLTEVRAELDSIQTRIARLENR